MAQVRLASSIFGNIDLFDDPGEEWEIVFDWVLINLNLKLINKRNSRSYLMILN